MELPEELEGLQEDLGYLALQISKYPAKSLSTLFELLSKEFKKHGQKDRMRGRPQRAAALHAAGEYLATSTIYLVTPNGAPSNRIVTSSPEIPLSEIRFRSYDLSRHRYGELSDFFTNMAGSLEQQKQYVVSGYLKEVQSKLRVAEKLSP